MLSVTVADVVVANNITQVQVVVLVAMLLTAARSSRGHPKGTRANRRGGGPQNRLAAAWDYGCTGSTPLCVCLCRLLRFVGSPSCRTSVATQKAEHGQRRSSNPQSRPNPDMSTIIIVIVSLAATTTVGAVVLLCTAAADCRNAGPRQRQTPEYEEKKPEYCYHPMTATPTWRVLGRTSSAPLLLA